MEPTSLKNTVSFEEINLNSFKDEILKSRINLNELTESSSIKFDIQNNSSVTNSSINKEYELNEIGLQVFILPGDDYFNKKSKLDYVVNLAVDEQKGKQETNQENYRKKNIDLKIDYKFPIFYSESTFTQKDLKS